MNTSDLIGADLDYWVARARGTPADRLRIALVPRTDNLICIDTSSTIPARFDPSTNWALAGPIIEREQINLGYDDQGGRERGYWLANYEFSSDKPLIAAMRAYVASVYGPTVEAMS